MNSQATPSFTFLGLPNDGKTVIASTIAGDDRAAISPTPGETIQRKEYKVQSPTSGEPLLILYDTPGFQNVGELIEWLGEQPETEPNPAAAFLETPGHRNEFPHDCEVLEALAAGSMPILVVDSSRKPTPIDRHVAEILACCKLPRIGVMNPVDGEGVHENDWRAALGKEIPTWHRFNPHTATPAERLRFIDGLRGHMQMWDQKIQQAIRELRDGMHAKHAETADLIVDYLRRALQTEVYNSIDAKGEEHARRKSEAKIKEKIRTLEGKFRRETLRIFDHHEERWKLPESLEYDLFHRRTWQLFGFSKATVVTACTLAGAATGTLIDIATGGGTMGIGALVGALVGGGAALLAADKIANIKVIGNKLGGRSICARIEHRSKLPSILLDRTAAYAVSVAMRPHGNRTSDELVDFRDTLSSRLEKNEETSSNASPLRKLLKRKSTRFQALVELWRRGKGGSKVEKAESWLREEITSYIESFAFPESASEPFQPIDGDPESTPND